MKKNNRPVGRPVGSTGAHKSERKQVSVQIEKDILEHIDKLCKKKGRARPDIINPMLRKVIEASMEKSEAA